MSCNREMGSTLYFKRKNKLVGKNITCFPFLKQGEWGEASCVSRHFSGGPGDQNIMAEAMESLWRGVVAKCNFSYVA